MKGAAPAIEALALLAVLLVLSAILVRQLLSAGQTLWRATLLSAATLLQPAYFGSEAWRAALLSYACYAVASAGAAFVQRQDPRRTVLLGGSLAGAQVVAPFVGIAATMSLPFVLRRSFAAAGNMAAPGLYVCLLFLPALMTLTLVYAALTQRLPVAGWDITGHVSLGKRLAGATASLIMALPLSVVLTKRRAEFEAPVLITIAAVIVARSGAGALLGGVDAVLSGSAALAVLSGCAACRRTMNMRESGILVSANFVVAWLLVFPLAVSPHA